MQDELKPSTLVEKLSISMPYASQLLRGKRPWPQPLAITAYRKMGVKLGPIAEATDEEIATLERFGQGAAA